MINKINIELSDTLDLKENNLAIGFFDGLHIGHKKLIEKTLIDGIPSVLTFSIDMKANIRKSNQLILNEEEKDEMLSSLGVKNEYVLTFNKKTKNASKEDFINFLNRCNPKKIIIGEDFTFSKNAIGKAIDIKNRCKNVKIIKLLTIDNKKISSTEIKRLLNEDIEKANKFLGYDFFINGIVIHGLKNGRKINFPTANIIYPKEKISLLDGVYKTYTTINGTTYKSMTNIGNHPSISPLKERIIETNIFDFSDDLYGKTIKVSFIKYIRPQIKFDSLKDVRTQLIIDKIFCIN